MSSRSLLFRGAGMASSESAGLPPVCPGFDSGPVSYVGLVSSWFFLPPEKKKIQIQIRPRYGSRMKTK